MEANDVRTSFEQDLQNLFNELEQDIDEVKQGKLSPRAASEKLKASSRKLMELRNRHRQQESRRKNEKDDRKRDH